MVCFQHVQSLSLDEAVSYPTIYFRKHHGKEAAFMSALSDFKHVGEWQAMVCFYDHDAIIGSDKFVGLLRSLSKRKFFIYPHSGRVSLIGDLYPTSPITTAHFVPALGHASVMRLFGHKIPIEICGWHLTPVFDFKSRVSLKPNVLFAPIHPNMSQIDKDINLATYKCLRLLAEQDAINLTVRYIKSLQECNLPVEDVHGISFIQGTFDSSYKQILESDVVVAHQTYAYMSVALGTPTIMMAEDTRPHNFRRVLGSDKIDFVKSWDSYKDLLMYPLDILNTRYVYGLIVESMKSDEPIHEWRERMIGEPFNPMKVLNTVLGYC